MVLRNENFDVLCSRFCPSLNVVNSRCCLNESDKERPL